MLVKRGNFSSRETHLLTSDFKDNFIKSKRSQVTIFIIIALIIVVTVVAYFMLKDRAGISRLSENFQPVEEYFLTCLEEQAEIGARLLGSQAGYIELPDFEPGSEYRPFSNQLDFLGSSVPYWYYLSGNNIIKEQVPSKRNMENQLAEFLLASECDFSKFEADGYEVSLEISKASVVINNRDISIDVDADLEIGFLGEIEKQTKHNTETKSSLGSFYQEALKIYNYEKENSFLENYAVDVLRLYAPVDGVELDCAPQIWLKEEIDEELKAGLEANMQAIRLKGDYYSLRNKEQEYFVQELEVENAVNFLYSSSWPTRIEVWESNNGVLLASPVGLQAGLGILGFCYVPYHFVYDVNYPVLIQLYNDDELFQFPVAVIIEKNKAREALPGTSFSDSEPELCKYKTQEIRVYTYNNELDAVEADISFNCLGQTCDIGKTEIKDGDAVLDGNFPACINGWVRARAEGYADKEYLESTNIPGTVNIILDKLYETEVELLVNGQETKDFAIINFEGAASQVVAWPEQKIVELSEGAYNVSVYVYKEGSITIPGMKKEHCAEVPKSGLGGLFGLTEEKCFSVDIPSQKLENVLAGGGKGSVYIVESQLESGKVEIRVSSLPVPSSLEKLQDSYNLLEVNPVYLEFE